MVYTEMLSFLHVYKWTSIIAVCYIQLMCRLAIYYYTICALKHMVHSEYLGTPSQCQIEFIFFFGSFHPSFLISSQLQWDNDDIKMVIKDKSCTVTIMFDT